MEKTFKFKELKDIILDESILLGIIWKENGKDLALNLDWSGQDEMIEILDKINSTRLDCTFVFDLSIKIDFGEFIGPPMIEEVNFLSKDNYIKVIITFKGDGKLEFNCSDCTFVIDHFE